MDNEKRIYSIMKEALINANALTGDLIKKINTEKGESMDFTNIDIQYVYDELCKLSEVLGNTCGSVEMYEHEWFDKM